MRPILAKLFGVPAAALTAREDGAPVKTVNTGAVVLAAPQGRPQVARAGDVLSFSVSATGEARIRLDVALPLETAKPLLRMLLDAGIVFGSGEAEP
jgi:hypothetical protein